MARCDCGNCTVNCPGACYCISDAKDPSIFHCDCIPPIVKKPKDARKIPANKSKRRFKITAQSRFHLCTHNAPITVLAQTFEKFLPNGILIPASKLTNMITLRLRNKTFAQMVIATGLTVID